MSKEKRRAAKAAEDAVADARSAVEDGLDEAHRVLKRAWRKDPVAVAATALGVGLVLGLLIGRRR